VTIRHPPKRLSDTPSGRAEHAIQTANAVSQLITGKQDLNANLTSIAGLDLTGHAGDVVTVVAGEDGFELAAGGGGGGGTTTNALTINNGGAGAASGATFNGSAAVTISYNTVGAAAASHTHASGDVTGLAAIATSGSASDLSAGTVAAARMPALTGDITTSAGAVATTLATVNADVGSFGSASAIPVITVNAKGLVTAVSTATPSGGTTDFQAADLVITSNNVFQDTDLAIALTAGSYAIESFYTADSNATPDMEVQFTYTGTVTDVAMIRYAARGSTTSAVEYEALPAAYTLDATDHYSVHMHGQITVSDSGTFKVQARQITSSATSVTFKKASWLRLTRLA
jgi:hypothetical protein